jgi:anaerobic dimethyl sulfoxide reductase subunit B (iron-sulfur subunit)
MAQYAFYLDASACSGCKACQVACQDKHGLSADVRWRRVYEVSGGDWRLDGNAWRQDTFAYYLSIACNHCERPICVEVCPTKAMHRRDDGLVLIDERKCIGCRYCEWACPYGAPQFDARAGVMGKCTFCAEQRDTGVPPACVAACGLRALDYGTVEELAAKYGSADVVPAAHRLAPASPPLPDPGLTRPLLLLDPHAHAGRAARGHRVANLEETSPLARVRHEPSLVAFTLLAQLAVGLYWAWVALRWSTLSERDPTAGLPLLAAGPLLLAGVLASLLHLGRPLRAWRALANLRSSWLSREILLTIKFLAGWAVVVALEVHGVLSPGVRATLAGAVALLGLALVYAMARVYRLRTVPAWDGVRTFRSFLMAALLLGALGAALLLAFGEDSGRSVIPVAGLFAAAVAVAVINRGRFYGRYARSGV